VGAIPGHHAISFECAGLALGKQADGLVAFFDVSRRKRNIIDYTRVADFIPAGFSYLRQITECAADFLPIKSSLWQGSSLHCPLEVAVRVEVSVFQV
jgi:hypothetical protein